MKENGISRLKNKTLTKHDVSHLTCCRSGAKISPTSCNSHLSCKPKFHIDDSQSELKVTCTLFASKKLRAKSIQQSNLNRSIRNNPTDEIYTVTNFIVYDRHYNRKMNSTQSNTTYEGASLMNFIMEVQWYVCLKEQINQQIVLNDVRQNLFGSSDEEAVTLKTSPPLILPLSSICYSMQEMEDSFLSDVVTEPGAYSIPPGNSEDSLLTLSFTSMGSSKDLFCATPPAIRVASPCSATELISPVSQALNRSNGDDEGFLLYALTEPDLEYSLSPPSTISFATSSPEAACDKFNVVDDNTAAIGKLEHLTVSKKLLYTVIEGHSVVVESSCPLATSQYLEQDLPDSGTSAIEYCEIEPMEEVRKVGSYSKRAVQFLVLGIGLVAVLLVFLWGINYLRTTMNVDLHSERPFISAPPRSSDNVVSSELHYPLVATISAEATTTVTVTAVPSASVLITTATARVGTAKVFLTTMKGAVLLSFQRFSRTWHKGGNVPIKAFIKEVANKCVNYLSVIYRKMFRRL